MNYILLPVVYFALAGRGQVRSGQSCIVGSQHLAQRHECLCPEQSGVCRDNFLKCEVRNSATQSS